MCDFADVSFIDDINSISNRNSVAVRLSHDSRIQGLWDRPVPIRHMNLLPYKKLRAFSIILPRFKSYLAVNLHSYQAFMQDFVKTHL